MPTETAGSAGAAPAASTANVDDPTAPYLGGAGIGVSDMGRSFAFYTSVMGMQRRYELMVPNYADEKILYFANSKGSDVVLMRFTDGVERNYTNNPVKLVFYVPSAQATIDAIRGQGLEIVSEPAAQPAFSNAIVGFGRDPDGYLLEIIEDSTLGVPWLGAAGIGVADIEASKAFYASVFDTEMVGDLIQIPNVWNEVLMRHRNDKGSAIVLMHWTDGSMRDYHNVPVKLAHFVPDVDATVAAISARGLPILSMPTQYTVEGVDARIALARDPDGYVLELITTL